MRMLIVDDQAELGDAMRRMAIMAGHEAILASDGREAVILAAEHSPTLVLLDINMPGIDGYETAHRLRERHGTDLLIFAVTSDPVDIWLAAQTGFDGIFAKPFGYEKMAALGAHLPP